MDRERRARPRGLQRLPEHHQPGHADLADQRRDARDVGGLHGQQRHQRHDVLLRRHGRRRLQQPVHRVKPGDRDPDGPPQQPTGLDLGASGAYVTFGDPAKLDLATFTIETWFKRTGAGVPNTTGAGGIAQFIPLVTHGGPEAEGSAVDANWLLGINDATDVLAADFEDTATGLNHPISGTTPLTNGVWYHAAATYDGTTWRLYLNGRLEATEAENATPRSDSTQHAGLGVMLNSSGSARQHRPVPGRARRDQGLERRTEPVADPIRDPPAPSDHVRPCRSMVDGRGERHHRRRRDPARRRRQRSSGAGTSWPAGAPFGVPTVDAGPNQDVTLPSNALLDGLALDDGQPSALTTTWTQISGP